jgi:hypothetical protein
MWRRVNKGFLSSELSIREDNRPAHLTFRYRAVERFTISPVGAGIFVGAFHMRPLCWHGKGDVRSEGEQKPALGCRICRNRPALVLSGFQQ